MVVDLWNAQEFRAGLRFGVVAALALVLLWLAASARARRRSIALGGVMIAVGGLWNTADNRHLPIAVVLAVIGIGAVGGLTHARWLSRWFCVALAVPFAWALGFHGELVSALWARVFVLVVVSGGAILVAEFDDAWRRGAPALTLFAITALGVYARVPDTELVAAVLGVSFPLVLLGWPTRVATLGRAGAAASVALLVWVSAVAGAGRPASIIPAVACLGLLVGNPLGQMLLPRVGGRLGRLAGGPVMLALLVSHVVIVLAAARVGGQLSDPAAAAGVGALTGMAAVVVGALFRPPSHALAPIHHVD
jgi:hypothetical protein